MKLDTVQTEQQSGTIVKSNHVLQETEPREWDFLDFLILFAERKSEILKITLAGTVMGVLFCLLSPKWYTAKTVVLPPQQSQSTATMIMNQLAGSSLGSLASMAGKDLGLKNSADLYIGMLKSRTIADSIIEKFSLQSVYRKKHLSDTRKELLRNSEIVANKSGLIEISVEDKNPLRAADIANTYVAELHRMTQHLAFSEAAQRRLFFEQQLQQAKDNLANAEVALKETEQKTGMIHLDSQARAIIEAIGKLQAQMAAKEVELRAMRSFATEQNPQVQIIEQQVAGLRDELAKLESQRPSAEGDPIIETGKVPEYGLEYMRRLRDVKYYETIFELLAKQFEAAKLDESKEAPLVQVVDQAIVPDRSSWPKLSFIVPIAVIVSLFGACFWVMTVESVKRVQEFQPEQAEKMTLLKRLLKGHSSNHDETA